MIFLLSSTNVEIMYNALSLIILNVVVFNVIGETVFTMRC